MLIMSILLQAIAEIIEAKPGGNGPSCMSAVKTLISLHNLIVSCLLWVENILSFDRLGDKIADLQPNKYKNIRDSEYLTSQVLEV